MDLHRIIVHPTQVLMNLHQIPVMTVQLRNIHCLTALIASVIVHQQRKEKAHLQTNSIKRIAVRSTNKMCKVFITLMIGVSMVETLFTPVYGTVH